MNEKRLQYAYEKMFTYLYYVKKTILALLNANFIVENKCSITMDLFLAKFFGKKWRDYFDKDISPSSFCLCD